MSKNPICLILSFTVTFQKTAGFFLPIVSLLQSVRYIVSIQYKHRALYNGHPVPDGIQAKGPHSIHHPINQSLKKNQSYGSECGLIFSLSKNK